MVEHLVNDFQNLIGTLDDNFTSNAHTSQNRLFGFITTNIRNIGSITKYIKELVPIYQNYKNTNDLVGWNEYIKTHQKEHKQKIKRLEIAKILFRNVENNKGLNDNAERLLEIANDYGNEYLELFLSFYLLSGKYFSLEKQPLIELEKIISLYDGNLLNDSADCVVNKTKNRIFFSTLFFNNNYEYILSYLLKNKMVVDFLKDNEFIKTKMHNAGGEGNFYYDVFIIANYLIFKNACLTQQNLENKIENYIIAFFSLKLDTFLKVEQDKLRQVLTTYKNLILDIFAFTMNIKDEKEILLTSKEKSDRILRSQNEKEKALEKYGKCFMDYCNCDSDLHNQMYFKKRDGKIYLEGHHLIQMENSKSFKNDIDIAQNIIPLCPNCHRKIHNAEEKEIIAMLKIIYKNKIEKEKANFIKNGIFVDLDTLGSFYGIEKEIKENK